MLTGLYSMKPERFDDVYGPQERASIEANLRIAHPVVPADRLTPEHLADVDVLVCSWGAPRLTAELLGAAPKLALVLYGAGSVRGVMTDEAYDRGVRITSAASANAVPVAEFALSQILFALKDGWHYVLASRAAGRSELSRRERGAYGAVVGLWGLSSTGRLTAQLLAHHDVTVLASDPYADPAVAEELGVRLVGLDELFATSDVVSLHAPLLPSTRGTVDARLLGSMKAGATLVNTARGGLVDESALVAALRAREDLFAVLDVTDPEPPVDGSPLFTLPNVVVTPHIAGSLGSERRRLGRLMAQELERYCAGEPLLHEVTRTALERTA
ncbi:hydroxyacid dehydrogenase [Actinomycetes bacterium KLBMP 9759]